MNAFTRCAVICSLVLIPRLGPAQREAWIATWTASPEPTNSDPNQPMLNLQNQTVRERVRISVGGSQVRIRLSNEYGSSPLHVGSVTVAVPNDLASVKSGSIHAVTFGGRDSITIPAGAPALSDPVALPVSWVSSTRVSLELTKQLHCYDMSCLCTCHIPESGRDSSYTGTEPRSPPPAQKLKRMENI